MKEYRAPNSGKLIFCPCTPIYNTYICRANNFLGAFSVVGLVLVRMTYVVTVLWAATFNGSKDRRKTFSNTNFGIREKSAQKL